MVHRDSYTFLKGIWSNFGNVKKHIWMKHGFDTLQYKVGPYQF